MLLVALAGCLINSELYEQRKADLTDHDGDSYVQEADCDDANPSVFPGAPEVCDGLDQDCDDAVDEGAVDAPTWYPDDDGDTFGDATSSGATACVAAAGEVANALDCDDGSTAVNPAADETAYDGIDEDCDGRDLTDVDGDGYDAEVVGGADCDDGDAGVNPSAEEEPYDGVDQDCQGGDANDVDGDGSVAVEGGGGDCDDGDAEVNPSAEETWANGISDNDCDGEIESVTLEFGSDAWIGGSSGGQAGRRVASLGDVTGDGLADYLVGAVYESSLHDMGGAVYLVEGGDAGGELATAKVLLAGGEDWYLPQVIEGGPDLDGDGVPELVATSTGYGEFAGAAFLVNGSEFASSASLSLPDAASGLVMGDHVGEFGGTGAAFVGDVMGDGGEYLAVSALFAGSGGNTNAGAVGVFEARTLVSERLSEGVAYVGGPYADATIGNVVAPAGDVDGDGVDDYFVSVGYGDLAYVVPGGVESPSLPGDAVFRLAGTGAGETGAAEMIGDVDGDGKRDLACLFEYDEVRVFTTLAANPVRTLEEQSATITLGEGSLAYDVLDLGDIDGDGADETFVPVQWYPELATSFAAVVFGEELGFRASVDLADARLTATSLRPGARFGYRAALSEDVDGDGGADIILGGYSDSEGGVDAGAVLTIPVPR